MKHLLTLILFAGALLAQTPVNTTPATGPAYSYFAATGINYDYYGGVPAITTGFGLRIGGSNAFSVTNVDSAVGQPGTTYATLRTGIEYHVVSANGWEFGGVAAAGATNSSSGTTGNFSGGAFIGYDVGTLLTKGKIPLQVVVQMRIQAITATEVKPVYGVELRKTF